MLIDSYAKINLSLRVLGKRPDGYHEIETLFSTINLHDSLKFALTKKPSIKILSNIAELCSENNLAYLIAQRIRADFGIKAGLEIYIDKRIPVAAGLGGGSSNAAVTFLALSKLFKIDMEESYMESTASEYGSDINFFFCGGLAKGQSRGEKITPMLDIETMELLLVNPGIAISSREAYQLADENVIECPPYGLWYNSLEAGIRNKYKVIDDILCDLKNSGAAEVMMSGSGSTCIALFADKAKQNNALNFFQSRNMWCQIVKTLTRRQYQDVLKA